MTSQTSGGLGRRLPLASLQDRYLAILPRIELHGRIYFRCLPADQSADAIQKMRTWPGSGIFDSARPAAIPPTS